MRFIWATRGRDWGFRFLRDAGLPDPLAQYKAAFAGREDEPEVCARVGDVTALRLLDPESRRDRAGRPIPHDFVLFDTVTVEVATVAQALDRVWPLVSAEYAHVWASSTAPN